MRFAVTALESFRLYRTEDWMTEERLLGDLLGTKPQTEAMARGLAFEQMLQTPDLCTWETDDGAVCVVGEHEMPRQEVDAARACLPHGVWQVPVEQAFGRHTLAGRLDLLDGLHVVDVKTTADTPDPEKYLASYQWRFYLAMLDATRFTYALFRLADDAEAATGRLRVTDTALVTAYPYDAIRQDCQGLVDDFAAFLEAKGLTDHPKFQEKRR